MRYLVIGLGIYGENLALDLTAMGHEVIGADRNEARLDAVKDYISTVYNIDSTEEQALQVLPLKSVDLVVVAIGENFGASVRTVALLKKAGVEHIFARAIDKLHEEILQSFNIDRILTPEQRAAADLTDEMALGTSVQSLRVDSDNVVLRFRVPPFFRGEHYSDIDLQKDYGLTLVAVCRRVMRRNILGIERQQTEFVDLSANENAALPVGEDDVWTVFGARKKFQEFFRHTSEI